MVIPKTLNDMQAMLDFSNRFNNSSLGLQQIKDGNLFVPDNIFIGRQATEQIAYTWEDYDPDINKGDWSSAYLAIFSANTVLSIAEEFIPKNDLESQHLNFLIGTAHFYRGLKFWELLQQFAPVYDENTASQQLGIVLNLSNNVQNRFPRSSVKESYDQVLSDLLKAVDLLPDVTEYLHRPNKTAGYALLSRVYLSIENYDEALNYSNLALNRYSTLMDYNNLSKPTVASNPFPRLNDEVIFHSHLPTYGMNFLSNSGGFVDTLLYRTFDIDDLRKTLFFREFGEYHRMNASYTGVAIGFGGIATDELYLTRAESKVRSGDISGGMDDLNTLLITRWKTGTFVPFTAFTETEALEIILLERRKQLLLRGLHWTDLKRLNKDPRFAITLTRFVQGTTYTLPPNDPRYAILIPNTEIEFNNLVVQNPR